MNIRFRGGLAVFILVSFTFYNYQCILLTLSKTLNSDVLLHEWKTLLIVTMQY